MRKTFHEICEESKKNVKACSVNDVIKLMENKDSEDFVLMDIREDNEYNAGHIKGAVHLGKGIIERDIHLHVIELDKKVILYCGGGYRSVLAAESLQRMGYKNVISMDGGWKGWNNENGEVE